MANDLAGRHICATSRNPAPAGMPGLQETPVLRPVRPLSLATAVLGTALAAAFLGTALTLLRAFLLLMMALVTFLRETRIATALLRICFEDLGVRRVVAGAFAANAASLRVMEKIGLTLRPERAFDHPMTPGWVGERHVVYAIDRPTWTARVAR